MDRKSLIVVDDFLKAPGRARAKALAASYAPATPTQPFAGKSCPEPYFEKDVEERMAEHIGLPLIALGGPGSVHGCFRFARAKDKGALDIHVDYYVDWTCILYLSPSRGAKGNAAGGTTFWRHKQTGLAHWPDKAESDMLHARRITDFQEYFHRKEGHLRARWEELLTVPMEYNRLVIFRGDNFHSATGAFGSSVSTGRLVQAFYYQEMPATTAWPPPKRIRGCSDKLRRTRS